MCTSASENKRSQDFLCLTLRVMLVAFWSRNATALQGKELKLYCRTCQVICRDCAIVTHKQHDYTFIKDVREELTKMESLSSEVEAKSGAFREQAEALEKTITSLNKIQLLLKHRLILSLTNMSKNYSFIATPSEENF